MLSLNAPSVTTNAFAIAQQQRLIFTFGGRYAWLAWENWLVGTDNGYGQLSETALQLSKLSDAITTV